MKGIFKEVIITILICIVVVFILGIVFYDYNPLNKIIPNKVAYSTPNEIKNEIGGEEVKDILDDGYNVIYSIDNSDLNKYKKSERYVPGKEHPFSAIEDSIGDDVPTGISTETETSEGTTTNPDSTGKIIDKKGSK